MLTTVALIDPTFSSRRSIEIGHLLLASKLKFDLRLNFAWAKPHSACASKELP
jgi:hypothetical protein